MSFLFWSETLFQDLILVPRLSIALVELFFLLTYLPVLIGRSFFLIGKIVIKINLPVQASKRDIHILAEASLAMS